MSDSDNDEYEDDDYDEFPSVRENSIVDMT